MLPTRQQIEVMSWREIQTLALQLRQSARGESFRQTSTRLYMEGVDELAELYEAMQRRSDDLISSGQCPPQALFVDKSA